MGREEGSGWGTHVYLWQIHFDIWQNQYNIVKLNKIKLKKKQYPRKKNKIKLPFDSLFQVQKTWNSISKMRYGVAEFPVQIPAALLPGCVTLGESLHSLNLISSSVRNSLRHRVVVGIR